MRSRVAVFSLATNVRSVWLMNDSLRRGGPLVPVALLAGGSFRCRCETWSSAGSP